MNRAFLLACAIAVVACDAPAPPVSLSLGALQLAEVVLTDEETLEASLTIDGILSEAPLALSDDRAEATGEFTLPAVTAETTRPFTIRLDLVRGEERVLLARLEGTTTLRPGANSLEPTGAFDTCGASGSPCVFAFDRNRNDATNLEDLVAGVDPLPPPPFVAVAPDTLQFASGVRLGEFARQAVVLTNRTDKELDVRASVVGAAGVTLARFTTDPDPTASAQRAIDEVRVGPFEEVLLAVSFAPVNGFLTTGAVSFEVIDPTTNVRQASQVALIANADGQLRPPPVEFPVPDPIAEGADLGGYDGPVLAFPAGELFSGLPVERLDEDSGLPLSGRALRATFGELDQDIPADAVFLVEIPPEHKLSAHLSGLDVDVDLGLIVLDEGDSVSTDGLRNTRPSAVGVSAEAVEHLNTTALTQRVLLTLGRLNPDDPTPRTPFALTAQLTNAPEFLGPPSPLGGPVEGGSLVTLIGRGFHPNAEVLFANALALECAHDDAEGITSIVCSAPPGTLAVGRNPATIVVRNPEASEGGDGQAATLPAAFTYQPPAPRLFSITPAVSTTEAGGSVTLSGAFFSTEHGVPAVRFGTELSLGVSFLDPTTLIAEVPAQGAGSVNVRVQNVVSADGALSIESNLRSFAYVEPEGDRPTVSGVEPNTGSVDGGYEVTLSGSGFQQGASVSVGGVLADATISASTSIVLVVPAGDAGAADIEVTNPDGQRAILADGFERFTPAPTLANATPDRATTTGGTFIAFTGSGFRAGIEVVFEQGGISASSPNVSRIDSEHLLVAAPAVATSGAFAVRATNFDGQFATLGGFTYVSPAGPPPQVTSISPNTGDLAFSTPVEIRGTGFVNPTVVFGSTAVSGAVLGSDGAAQLLSFDAPTSDAPGPVVVRVTNSDGQGDTTVFNYFEVQGAAPTISSVTPGEGGAGTQIVISGATFDANASLVLGSQLIDDVESLSSSRAVVTMPEVVLQDGVAAANLSLELRNTDGQIARSTFRYLAPVALPPRVTSISPDRVPTAGGASVTVSGFDFDTSGGAATLGAQVLASVGSPTSVTFTAPSHAPGLVLVRITNGDGQFAEVPFRYEDDPAPAPAVALTLPNRVSGVVDDARVVIIGQDLDAVDEVVVQSVTRTVASTLVAQSSGSIELQLNEVLGSDDWTIDLRVAGASSATAAFVSRHPAVTVADLDSGGLLIIGSDLAGAALTGGGLRLASGGPTTALSIVAASDTLAVLEMLEPPLPGADYRFDLSYPAVTLTDFTARARTASLVLSQSNVQASTNLQGTSLTATLDETLPTSLIGPLVFDVSDGGAPQQAGTWQSVAGGVSLTFDAITLPPGSYEVRLRGADSSSIATGQVVAQ